MNNLSRGLLDEVTHQISKAWAFYLQTRSFKDFLPGAGHFLKQGCNLNNLSRRQLEDATYQISKTWAFYFQTRGVFVNVFLI